MPSSTPTLRAVDTFARDAEAPVPIALLRQIGVSDGAKAQHRAHVIALAKFHADNGTRLDATGRPILRHSEARKVNARLREIEEIRGLIPGAQPAARITATAPASTPTLSANQALLRLLSI